MISELDKSRFCLGKFHQIEKDLGSLQMERRRTLIAEIKKKKKKRKHPGKLTETALILRDSWG